MDSRGSPDLQQTLQPWKEDQAWLWIIYHNTRNRDVGNRKDWQAQAWSYHNMTHYILIWNDSLILTNLYLSIDPGTVHASASQRSDHLNHRKMRMLRLYICGPLKFPWKSMILIILIYIISEHCFACEIWTLDTWQFKNEREKKTDQNLNCFIVYF